MMKQAIVDWDHSQMRKLVYWRASAWISFFKVVTYTGYGRSWWTVAGLFMLLGHAGIEIVPFQEKLLQAMLGALISYLLCALLKRAFKRRRPFQVLSDSPALIKCTLNDSFPSAHAASWFAFFVASALLGLPASLGVGVWALLVSFSRYFLGVHFPSDLLAGAFIGIVCGFAVLLLGF